MPKFRKAPPGHGTLTAIYALVFGNDWRLLNLKKDPVVSVSVESKISQLKEIITLYERDELQTFIAGILMRVGKAANDPFLKNLLSPQRQLFFLALLNLEQVVPGKKRGFTNEEWDQIANLLHEIEAEYFYMLGWPKSGFETAGEVEKIRLSMASYMNYFFNAPLSFPEQEIGRIRSIFHPFDGQIKERTGLSVADYLEVFDLFEKIVRDNLVTATFYLNLENKRKLVLKGMLQGLTELDDIMDLEPEKIAAAKAFLQNPGSILKFDPQSLEIAEPIRLKLIRVLNIFVCKAPPKDSISYYTDPNILFEKPILKLSDNNYLMFFTKQYLYAVYNYLWNLCTTIDKTRILRSKDVFAELKVYDMCCDLFAEDGHIYINYNIGKGQPEQDILVLHKGKALIIEVKAAAQRAPMREPVKAFEKIRSDFKTSIQKGYDQCLRIKQKFLDGEEFDIYDEKGKFIFHVPVNGYHEVYSIVVTIERYGLIQTDLSNLLILDDGDEYPWSVCIDDLEAFLYCLKKKGGFISSFFAFLNSRQFYQGHLFCNDELEMCGMYLIDSLRFKKLSEQKEMVYAQPHLSAVIDKEYYTGLGLKDERYFREKRDGTMRDFYHKEK